MSQPRWRVLAWALWDSGSTGVNAIAVTFVFSVYLTRTVGADLPGVTRRAASLTTSDEPTSGLDPIMTATIDRLTRALSRDLGMTAVVVTHDMRSAFRIASRLIMLGKGPRHGTIIATGKTTASLATLDLSALDIAVAQYTAIMRGLALSQ